MSEPERLTIAKVVDGILYVNRGDGVWRKSESRTDLNAIDRFTEDEIEAMAVEDGTNTDIPDNARVVIPRQHKNLKTGTDGA
ncbi:MAG: hypothetical protein GVY13_07700 [Alphaproteobacteria bacterium]|jgi:hypothetical protein|nr:hypothetical protein [Alphaproteobacteria bacterium]